jgi:hypothetical protein
MGARVKNKISMLPPEITAPTAAANHGCPRPANAAETTSRILCARVCFPCVVVYGWMDGCRYVVCTLCWAGRWDRGLVDVVRCGVVRCWPSSASTSTSTSHTTRSDPLVSTDKPRVINPSCVFLPVTSRWVVVGRQSL